jgi:hypothetical protein
MTRRVKALREIYTSRQPFWALALRFLHLKGFLLMILDDTTWHISLADTTWHIALDDTTWH